MVWLDRRGSTSRGSVSRPARVIRAVSVLALVAALAASVQVYRVGDSGARAAWGDQVAGGM